MGTLESAYSAKISLNDSLMDSNLDGVAKVKQDKGKYAFFLEQGSIDYSVKENCDLMQVGEPLNSRNYGLALKKGKGQLEHSNRIGQLTQFLCF